MDGAEVVVKRVPETMPPQYLKKQAVKRKLHRLQPRKNWRLRCHYFWYTYPLWQHVRSKRTFLDQTGGLWASGALYGKRRASLVPPVLAAVRNKPSHPLDDPCASRHGDCPHWLRSAGLFDVSQVRGGTPYGATTIAAVTVHASPARKNCLLLVIKGICRRSGS